MAPSDDSTTPANRPLIDVSPAIGAPSSTVVPPGEPDVGDVVDRGEDAPQPDAAISAVIAPPD